MGLHSLAEQEILTREKKVFEHRTLPQITSYAHTIQDQFKLDQNMALEIAKGVVPAAAGSPPKPNTRTSAALEALVRYIPTESITLYVAAMSALGALQETFPTFTALGIYLFFVILTPLLFLLIYGGKRIADKLPPFPSLSHFPWWKTIAATIAFSVWALAIPGAPFFTGAGGGAIAGFLAVFISVFLTLFEPFFDKN